MSRPSALAWTPFVLLGLLTIASHGGAVAIFLALRGGTNPDWPPDRPIEWGTFYSCHRPRSSSCCRPACCGPGPLATGNGEMDAAARDWEMLAAVGLALSALAFFLSACSAS